MCRYVNGLFFFLKHMVVLDVSLKKIFFHLHMKLFEVEDAIYQKMATHSENDGEGQVLVIFFCLSRLFFFMISMRCRF